MTMTGAASDIKHIPTVVLEGNGSRPSHHGDGYVESDIAYTLNATEHHAIAFSQDAYDEYNESSVSAALKQSGGNIGGERDHSQTVGALCSRDYKGVGNQYVNEGKLIIQKDGF